MRFDIKPVNAITVTSSAIFERDKKAIKSKNQTSGAEGERKELFSALRMGTKHMTSKNSEIPDSIAPLPRSFQSGKKEITHIIGGTVDTASPIK